MPTPFLKQDTVHTTTLIKLDLILTFFLDLAPAHLGTRELMEVFLPVFEAAIVEGNSSLSETGSYLSSVGGAKGVMAAYSELDGIPNTANNFTLTEILRNVTQSHFLAKNKNKTKMMLTSSF